MFSIPQSTAYTVMFKAFLSSDHVSEATSKTIAITISKNGGAFGNPNAGATNATEVSSGWYKVALDTTDTATLGPLAIRGAVATVDDVGLVLNVVSATTGGLTNLDAAISSRMATYTQPTGFLAATFPSGTVANTTNITAGTITTTTNLTNLPSIPNNWLTAAGIAASALNGKGDWLLSSSYTAPPSVASIATGVWQDTTAGDFTAANSIGKSVMNGVALGTGLTINDITTKTGYALTAAYDSAKTASQAGDAMALTSGERNSTADAILGRNVSGGSSTGRTVKQALHFLRNKWSISAGTLTVYDTDDSTSSWTAAVATDGTAQPIVSNDPA